MSGRHASTTTKPASTSRTTSSGNEVATATPSRLAGNSKIDTQPTTGHEICWRNSAAREPLDTSWIEPWIGIATVGATNWAMTSNKMTPPPRPATALRIDVRNAAIPTTTTSNTHACYIQVEDRLMTSPSSPCPGVNSGSFGATAHDLVTRHGSCCGDIERAKAASKRDTCHDVAAFPSEP